MSKELISIITPVYNEELNIDSYFSRLNPILDKLGEIYNFEIIFTDNCSEDDTFNKLKSISEVDKRISVYRFTKNYGYQKSIWTGYNKCRGDAAVELDADLQDPPEMIEQMLEYRRKGFKIVFGERKDRKEGFILKSLRKFFYRLVRSISEYDIPNDAGDFLLIDRSIIEHLKKSQVTKPYLRGTIFGFGYSRIGIPYKRDARYEGKSKFSTFKLVNLASDAIVNTSTFPLRIALVIGLLAAAICSALGSFLIIEKLFYGNDLSTGITATLVIVLFSLAVSAILIGIVGEYVGRIYSQLTSSDIVPIIEEEISDGDSNLEYHRDNQK